MRTRMHVAIATPAFPLPRSGRNAGIERLSREMAQGFLARDVDVTVVTTFWNGGPASERLGRGTIYRVDDTSTVFGRWAALGDSHYWSWGFRAARVLQERVRPDVVHSLIPLAGAPALTKAGFPVVTTFHHPDEIWQLQDLLHRPFHRILESRGYHASTLLVTPSRASARAVERTFGVAEPKIRVVYWGVNSDRFKPGIRRDSSETRILYVGHHERRKGLIYLLEAVAILRRQGIPVRLTTAGGGQQLAELRRVANDLGIGELVTFLGHLPDPDDEKLPQLYSQADVFVFPSLAEGFGFVLVEAMASGLPVVASDISAIPEVVGDAGVLFPARNPEALAEILRELAEDPRRRTELGARGRDRVESRFTWNTVIPKLISTYEEAIHLADLSS